MTYENAVEKIHSLLTFGSRPGLDRMRILLDRLGNPQDRLKFIHIAGTNGKGSVCAMLSSALVAAGYNMKKDGGVLITVRDTDKQEIIYVADKFEQLGFDIYATGGTASTLNRNMVAANVVRKASEEKPNVMTLLDSGKINYVISTSAKGRIPAYDSVKIRRKTVERSICCLTAIDTANAVADILAMGKNIDDMEMIDITKI